VVLSLIIHGALFLLATTLVVFTVVKKEEQKFEAPKAKERPKIKLKKPRVRMKKTSRPKAAQRIVSKSTRSSMPDISLPTLSGMGNDIGGLEGLDLLPDIEDTSVFGSSRSVGNDFVGILYDLKRDRHGGEADMDRTYFLDLLAEYFRQGWKDSLIDKYYKVPNKLYTTHFVIPPIPTPLAPDRFGDPEMGSYFFFIKYVGKLVYKEDIKFRFWGVGDAYACVNVGGRDVFLNGKPNRLEILDSWHTSFPKFSDNYYLGTETMKVGDWIELKAGEPVEMKVLFGEWVGGQMSCILLVEVAGEKYPTTKQGGPLLPAFKTEEFSMDQMEEIYKYMPEGECSFTNGPIFRDF